MAPLKTLYEKYKVGLGVGLGNSLVVQWLGLGTFTAGAHRLGTEIPQTERCAPLQKKRIKNEVKGPEV